ncbi:MAG: nitrate reductase cytochrome c-type subunit [Epsilonproteobacteria bacterium]|nr:nitrate reductase cytochrome c-type subunit [Campylobacterota bacterium]
MKMLTKSILGFVAASFLLTGCGSNAAPTAQEKVAPTITEEQLSYRNTSLYHEKDTVPPTFKFSDAPAGASQKFQRAFQDAPPMIPHDTEGMLPITRKDGNQCLNCHIPEIASSMGATPIPPSHFMDMRPKHKWDGKKFEKAVDNLKNEVAIVKKNKLYQGRWNCSQCHAPQSDAKLITENRFQPEYLSKDGAFKSHWDEVMTKDLDTVGKESIVTPKDVANEQSSAGESVWEHH